MKYLQASLKWLHAHPKPSPLQSTENLQDDDRQSLIFRKGANKDHIINNSFVNIESSPRTNGTEYQRSPCKVGCYVWPQLIQREQVQSRERKTEMTSMLVKSITIWSHSKTLDDLSKKGQAAWISV